MYSGSRPLIGVFLNNINNVFHTNVCTTLSRFGLERDYDIAIFNTFGNSESQDAYEDLETRLIDLAPIERFDAIIILADTFGIYDQRLYLLRQIRKRRRDNCPVINLRGAYEQCKSILNNGGFYQVTIGEELPYEMLVEHAITQHGARNICFMSGPKGHPDAERRLSCFRRVAERHSIHLHDNAIFYGDFWHNMTTQALDYFYSDLTWKPDAIICANDYMAIDVNIELMRRRISVPRDVIVIGFDDIPESSCCYPSLTTMGVDACDMVTVALNTIEHHWNGERIPQIIWMEPQLKKRESCGCYTSDTPDLRMVRNTLLDNNNTLYMQQLSLAYSYLGLSRCVNLADLADNVLSKAERLDNCRDFYMLLCTNGSGDDIASISFTDAFTDEFLVALAVKDGKSSDYYRLPPGQRMISRRQLLPDMAECSEPSCFYFVEVHSTDKVYGYTACRFYNNDVYDFQYDCWMMSLAVGLTEILNRLRLERALALNEQISVTDSLTGLLNRRGFENYAGDLFSGVSEHSDCIFMASIDLDGLKQINDRYGHGEGDFAIRTVGEAIRTVVGDRGIASRMGGDEFVVMIRTDDCKPPLDLDAELRIEISKRSASAHKPYRISASVGCCCGMASSSEQVELLLRQSDEKLYEAKRALRRRHSDAVDSDSNED